MEEDSDIEKQKLSSPPPSGGNITLQKAIDLGEYNPEFLSGFAEWHTLSRFSQFQFIRKALDNRRRHLLTQWAEISNSLDFSKKPYLAEAMKNIKKQLDKLEEDREKLYVEYSTA